MLPNRAATRQVIAADFEGHGRTNDIDQQLTCADLASDVVGLLPDLDVSKANVGFSVGGGVALHLAIRHPELVRKVIASSLSLHPDGDHVVRFRADRSAAVPVPDRLPALLRLIEREWQTHGAELAKRTGTKDA